jgi:phenylpropionate dioxygenase-like ring-hydroxylating dioxygenase large terminal subunit
MKKINSKDSNLTMRDGALKNNWYIACLSSDLREKPISRTIYDLNIVLFRDHNKKASALIDRCVHRAAKLSAGQVVDGKIECPYHGWKYNNLGEVLEVPSEGDHLLKGKRCQEYFETCEQDGVVWLWMGENKDISIVKKEKIWKFPHLNEAGWIHYFMVTDFNNEVTNLAENFMDVPHTVFVHKGWFRNKTLTKVPITIETKNAGVLVTYHQKDDAIGVLIKPLLNPKSEPMTHTDHFIFPNVTCVDYSFGENYKYVINSQITPVSTMQSRVYTYIGYKIPIIGFILKPFIQFYTRQVIEQDVWIMDVQSANLNPDLPNKFQSTPADEPHLQIERLRSLGVLGDNVEEITKKVETTIWL